ncbi:MAG: molybdopterin-dependent oxidoreductase [Promethearchaeota archaeon]
MPKNPRLPPGQRWISEFPVRTVERSPPVFNPDTWTLTIDGEVDTPLTLSYAELRALPTTTQTSDFHCVEGWSVPDNRWEGIRLNVLAARVRPRPHALYVTFHAEHGYASGIPLEMALADDVLLAWSRNGTNLSVDDGWPLRLVVPRLYAYKSVKWVRRITFTQDVELGYWEQRGFHQEADPWREQRTS